ncbi:MAG: phosphodiester glycosidase family protein, partial [Firmicutes bacterium]|nr:phosphodiester glycosidase family protein [Bacillota bacterium]
TKDGRIELGAWHGEGYVQVPGREPLPLAGVNKPGTDYAWPILYTPDWGSTSPATPPGVVTLIGVGSRVVRVSEEGEQPIPAGEGFALVAGNAAAEYFRGLGPTDSIECNYTTSPKESNYKVALGGGAILLREGKIVSGGHDVPGRHPRSAAGVSADGKTLYLVAVDGRQDESRGLTQEELARVLLNLGAAEAINFDGGGSTTLISRPLGFEQPVVKNVPSGGSQRNIANGLGLFTIRGAGPAAGLILSTADGNVILNGSRRLTLRAYDDAYNPVALPPGEPNYEVIPRDLGQVVQGIFQPRRTGKGQIKVRLGSLEAECDIRVIGPAIQLSIAPDKINVEPGSQGTFTLTAVDAWGYQAVVEPGDPAYEIRGEIGTLAEGIFTAARQPGSGALVANLDGIQAGALITVGREVSSLERFASPTDVSFLSWPQGLPGGISFQKPPKPLPDKEENAVLALNYDFTPREGATRAAYVVLGEEGLPLESGAQSLGLWVYGDGSGHWLRGRIEDAEGQLTPLDFARRLDWEGWRYVRAPLPSTAPGPLTLRRIYLTEPDTARGEKGVIYLADLQKERSLSWATGLLPQVEDRKEPPQALRGEKAPPGTKLLLVGNISTNVDGEALGKALIAKKKALGAAHILTTDPLPREDGTALPVLPAGALPTSFRGEGFNSIYLEAGLGGLRETNFQQWPFLEQELTRMPANFPLFIFCNRPPYKGEVPGLGFNNRAEAALLRQYLREHQENSGQEVWALCGGTPAGGDPWWRLEEGVLYLGLPPVTSAGDFDYLLVTLGPAGPVYSWQRVGE